MKKQNKTNKAGRRIKLGLPVYLAFVAYNEELTLPSSFRSVEMAARHANKFYDAEFKAIICHNGCTDNTPATAASIAKNATIDTQIISSRKGMVVAQNKCIRQIRKATPESIVVFTDADCVMNPDVIKLFLDQFHRHKELLAVGAHPLPASAPKSSIIRRIKHRVLNFRAYHPKSQVSARSAPEYHPFALSDPQPIGPEFELRSKTYFHGRCFALRHASLWDVPECSIGEDTYLDCSLHTQFGPQCIRQLYHANVYFSPLDSIRSYIRTYARIYKDKNALCSNLAFKKNFEYSKTRMDFSYLREINMQDKACFIAYWLLDKLSNALFFNGLFIRNSTAKLWSYAKKEVVFNANSNTPSKA